MSDAVLVAIITGLLTLTGTVFTIISTSRKQTMETDKKLAIMQADIASMKEDIKSHNGYARMFSENIPAIKQHMEDVDRRLDGLERRAG